jgi:hypothetical protein
MKDIKDLKQHDELFLDDYPNNIDEDFLVSLERGDHYDNFLSLEG